MAVYKIKLVRHLKRVTLELTEGLPLTKGQWTRIPEDSTSKLKYESGEWENWILGDPGGDRNLRLYDSTNTKSAILNEFVTGATEGKGKFLFDDFSGDFGSEPFDWFLML